MSPVHESILEALNELSSNQIRQAGQRYTPGLDPNAPNLVIKRLVATLENVACGVGALTRFQTLLDSFDEAWSGARHCSQHRYAVEKKASEARQFLPVMIVRLRACDATAVDEWSELLSGLESELEADTEHWRVAEENLQPGDKSQDYSSAHNTIRSNLSKIRECLTIVRDEQEYVQTASFKALFDPQLLVNGEWGTGKTHLMCDFARTRLDRGCATILVLAKNFQADIVKELCERISEGVMEDEAFDRVQRVAEAAGERAVVIIDGVNEGHRSEWREAVSRLQALVSTRPGIGLIVTCRTPFETFAISPQALNNFHQVTHFGFDDQEFDAQAAFFEYYNLPLPEVPLLAREFSRPLTLKLICQSLQKLTKSKMMKGFAGIASGQKGMTYVLESFVNRIGDPIERQFGLKSKGCWELLKGSDQIADNRVAGFAPSMAAKLHGYVWPATADQIIAAQYPRLKPAKRRQLLEALRTSGLIEEDAIWYSSKAGGKYRSVFRLPYQRFSDHLIARHLLKTYLDTSSAAAIQKSFTGKAPLARIFRIPRNYQREYAEPGWAQALITEFPTRVKKHLPSKKQELYFVLPSNARNANAYFNPFIEGIFWRDPSSFTEGTKAVINHYLNAGAQAWELTVDALAAVATKPKHPYHSRRLYDFLASYAMPDRDLRWSEYLRRRDASPTIHRLLTWTANLEVAAMTHQSAKELIILLSLVLTTVNRSDRDIATKALVLIGERFPEALFEHAVTSLEFNDPYLPERMLAAAYGTTLSLMESDRTDTFRPLLGDFAKTLYRMMFGPRARNATHHTLIRDYALGIIEMAQYVNCVALPITASRYLAAPFPSTQSSFKSDGTPDPSIKNEIDHSIHMDFGNYTIGRLIANRANYDDKDPEYVAVRAKIERRIFDLGYRTESFSSTDQQIGRMHWHSRNEEKVDRYGKKYSWIAYFEMWGERFASRELPEGHLEQRTSDCGVDPSFPKPPPDWVPPVPDLFGDRSADTAKWVAGGPTPNWNSLLVVQEINGHPGPWVLVDGFVRGTNPSCDRELFAFLRGLFVARKDVYSLRGKYLALDYPGNGTIPEGAEEHYLYAAEAGRRNNYAKHLLGSNGKYRRQAAEVFAEYVNVEPEEVSQKIGIRLNFVTGDGEKSDDIVRERLISFPKRRKVPGIRVEIPIIRSGWESYHSTQNTFANFLLPAPKLLQGLSLSSKGREIDFYDSNGRPGTLYRESGDGRTGDRHSLLYVRADLLQRYLTDTRQTLVWCNWGERDWLKRTEGNELIADPKRQQIYQSHHHIHRSFSTWSAKDYVVA